MLLIIKNKNKFLIVLVGYDYFIVGSDCMFDIGNEFDEMYSLIGQMGFSGSDVDKIMGFSGSDVDKIMGFILHSINQTLRGEMKKWTANV